MEFFEWIKLGYEKGFCSDVACSTHDPLYTHEEMEGFEQGDDPCLHMVRIFSPGYVAYEPLEKSQYHWTFFLLNVNQTYE